ncbi:rhodanese-like domain-containing protein [Gallaecimonas mangrovi]|uniref:rhodanese-like domain-containing protein n=1 Tax=Gallaecimonas mangrovi TaxID=2291597 RepID=UPI000E1FDDD7|nr:rhodanese-like domain-containing protein [Gallaecimonas mangrovi]
MNLSDVLTFAQHNPMPSIIWVVVLALLIISVVQGMISGVKKIKPQQAVFLINQDDSVVVDIRSQADFKKGHIANALNLAKDELLKGEATRLEKHKDAPIIVVCDMGHSAQQVAKQLKKGGFKSVFVLSGGIQGWRDAGMPVKG